MPENTAAFINQAYLAVGERAAPHSQWLPVGKKRRSSLMLSHAWAKTSLACIFIKS